MKQKIGVRSMRVKSGVRAGGVAMNHNETLVHDLPRARGMRVKTGVKAGGVAMNHNETFVRDVPKVRGMR